MDTSLIFEPLARLFNAQQSRSNRRSEDLFCPFHACLRTFDPHDPKDVRLPIGAPVEDAVLARAYELSANPRLNPSASPATQQEFLAHLSDGGIPICPSCHSRLVPHQERGGGYIAIMGERAAGKTVFLASKIRYVCERFSQLGVSIRPHVVTDPSDVLTDKSSLELLMKIVADPVHSLPMATNPNLVPYSYSFEALMNTEGSEGSFNLLFLDSAGERQIQGREWLSRYILRASGILLLISPESVPGFAGHLAEVAPRSYADQPVVQMLVDTFSAVSPSRVPPLMVALSKADLLAGPGQPLNELGASLRISEHQTNQSWVKDAGTQWSRSMTRILRQNGFDTTFLDRTFPRISYTAISSTGGGRVIRNQSLEQSLVDLGEPWRCMDPLYFFRHARGMR